MNMFLSILISQYHSFTKIASYYLFLYSLDAVNFKF